MNYARIALASLGAIVVYFVYGFAMFAAWPSMKTEFMKYPNVYRPKDEMMKVMPYGIDLSAKQSDLAFWEVARGWSAKRRTTYPQL